METPLITARNVSYSYKNGDEVTVGVQDLSLDVNRGEFCVILGHNGSGKSTFAKLLNGFLLPDEGEIFVDGVDTKDEQRVYDIRSKVGMVFQNPDNQMVASIIEDDVAFGPENLGVPREEIIQRVDAALNAVNMTEYRTRTPHKLSGGQKQRVAIAAILAMRPSVLILDESTAMLDPEGRREVLDVVRRLNREDGVTVILITHYMDEAVGADRVFVFDKGRCILRGTPREVFSETDTIRATKLELPVATSVSADLSAAGYDVPLCLTDEELCEAICKLS
ncbi:MAG: energy-coupling factor transporter ATPase [Clostridia bacterium]|nr:energy-coupling factor transporter ATPase [Clostridia bacterium]